jgi:tetratricopeptide (TPR) repeat protein
MPSRPADGFLGIGIRLVGIVGLSLSACSWDDRAARAQSVSPGAQGGAANEEFPSREDRRKALELSYDHRDLEALPLLEALAQANPKDREVQERLAVALVTKSATVAAEEEAARLRRARAILAALKASGPISDLSEILIEEMPADAAVPTFSSRADAEAAMKEGEAAFARRDFANARLAYRRALRLDPRLYSAALFVGDTFFAEEQFAQARTWFSRAVLIDPNRETAHRYLGDAQARSGLAAAARMSYLNAVVAEPYTRRPWIALTQWAKENNVTLGHPRIVPEELEDGPDGQKGAGSVKPEADPHKPDDGRSQWHRYDETRAAWAAGRFKATFPGEVVYRHSLAEEADALRQVALAIAGDVKASRITQPHPCFANLQKLVDEGLLEAHVLYARADKGIAQDYAAYRAAHRDLLRRYLTRYFAPGKPGEDSARHGLQGAFSSSLSVASSAAAFSTSPMSR